MNEKPPEIPSRNEDYDKFPDISDTILDLIEDIKNRERQRQKARNILLEKANTSLSEDERDMWLSKARELESIHQEYRGLYPEVFRGDDPENGSNSP